MTIYSSESDFKADLAKKLREHKFHVIRHEDKFTYSVPDMSVTDNNITSWWEVKHKKIIGNGKKIQLKNMKELCKKTILAYYIVYNHIFIQVRRPPNLDMKTEPMKEFYSMDQLVEYILNTHWGYD